VSPSQGPPEHGESRLGPLDSLPAPIVPLSGANAVTVTVTVDAPLGLRDTGTAQVDGPAEHRAESSRRPSRLKVRAHGGNAIVFCVTGVVLAAVVAAILVLSLGGRSGPSPRFGAVMVDDSSTGQPLLMGGQNQGLDGFTDMWTWSGKSWKRLTEQMPASASVFSDAGYDAATRQVVLFTPDHSKPNTWTWDGSEWALTTSQTPSPSGYGAPTAYDGYSAQLVAALSGRPISTWCWNGVAWQRQTAAGLPNGIPLAMAYDPRTAQLLLVVLTGTDFGEAQQTWTYSDGRWKVDHPASQLGIDKAGSWMAYDDSTRQVVAFGSGPTDVNETWTWNGSSWNEQHTPQELQVRGGVSAAYDSTTNQLLQFGGDAGNESDITLYNDTWDWTGTTWIKVA
jgi:hypothetical protein